MTDFKDFLPIISGAIGGATASGVLNGPIQTLEDWWYVKFGYKASNQAALLKAKQEANVEKLKRDILNEVDQIPIENFQEPRLKILGPALDASRYYIEEEELRMMFAKIIASSLDNRKNNIVHSSFVEIIKQLDVLDAKLLSYFKKNHYGPQTSIPVMKVETDLHYGKVTILQLVYLSQEFENFQQNAISLTNLERLGIITFKKDRFITDDSVYSFIRNSGTITHLLMSHPEMELGKYCFSITDFGQSFIEACVI